MTQLELDFDLADLLKGLRALTLANSKVRLLGEWYIARGGRATTVEIVNFGRDNFFPSALERFRCDLKARIGWPIKKRAVPGSRQWEYYLCL